MPGNKKGNQDQLKLDELLPLSIVAKHSGLSQSHLRRLLRDDEIEGKKMGRDWFTTLQAVREYESRDHRPGPKPKS